MSKWLNNKKRIFNPLNRVKPCRLCEYCPYGGLVEEFPISEIRNEYSCKVFGHDCPVYYLAENIVEY